MGKDYIYEGMTLYNIQKRKVIVKEIKWESENRDRGILIGHFMENLTDKNVRRSKFAIEDIGKFLFYELHEVEWRDNYDILGQHPKYVKYSDKVRKHINRNEFTQFEQDIARLKNEFKKRKEAEKYIHQIKIINKLNKFHNYLKTNYGFEGFIHTADFSNFVNIMKSGYIYSRNEATKRNYLVIDSADKDIINGTYNNVKDSVRFYFRPKTPTNYNNEGIRPYNPEHHMPIPVMLIADRKIYKYSNILITDGNARSNNTIFVKNVDSVYRFNFEDIFSIGKYNNSNYSEIKRRRNAELLVLNKVSIKDIKKIVFRSMADLKMAKLLFGNDPRFIIDENRFFNEHQYCKDYAIKIDENNVIFGFKLNKTEEHYIRQFTHILRLWFIDSKTEYNLFEDKLVRYEHDYYSMIGFINVGTRSKYLKKIEYLIDGNISAVWRRKYD